MALPPFNASIIPEFDTVNERPTWIVKFDGKPIARVVEVQTGVSFKDHEYRIMRKDFEGPCPWNANHPLKAHPTERAAIWAIIEDAVLCKEIRERSRAANE